MSRAYDRDPYAILGISPTATASQVKEAYHRLARQYHPDLNRDPRAGERMKDINWAYDILSDPQERSLYDYWLNTGVRTEYYYPGTSSPSSDESQTYNSPPYNPYRGRTYPNFRGAQKSTSVGCSSWGIVWVIIILVTNLVRAIGPAISQRPNYDYSLDYSATQSAQLERLDTAIETLHASQGLSTASVMSVRTPSFQQLATPSSPAGTREEAEPVQEGWRAQFTPGTWGWHYLNLYFPDLTTATGVSAEVTDITYDQLRGYHIKTRSSGDYWLLISPYDNSVAPAHTPPAVMATPTR